MKKSMLLILVLVLSVTSSAFGERKLTGKEWEIVCEINNALDSLGPQRNWIPAAEERADEERVMRKIANKYGMTVEQLDDIYAKSLLEFIERKR